MQVSRKDFKREVVHDEAADASYLEQPGFEARLAAWRRNELNHVAVRATVELEIPHGEVIITQRIESPGLWGIEADSDAKYLDSVFKDECDILASMLETIGITVTA